MIARMLGCRRSLWVALLGLGSLSPSWAQPAPTPADAADVIRIGASVDRLYAEPLEALLRKAYAGIGRKVSFVELPLLRAPLEMRAGKLDATTIRAQAFYDQNPDILKIDVPIMTLSIYALARSPCPAEFNPALLGPARVAYQRGSAIVESVLPPAARQPANTPSDAILALARGAADFALLNGTPALADVLLKEPMPQICRIARPVTENLLFHGVHQRHAALVAPLESQLAAMRERGEIQAAWTAFERAVQASRAKLVVQPGRSLSLEPAGSPAGAGASAASPAAPPRPAP
jgi:hypothetical protein